MTAEMAAREVAVHIGGLGDACTSVLTELPEWFGIPESNQDYIDHAQRDLGVLATVDGQVAGLTTIVRHSDDAAEVYLMAVRPRWHRQGVGRAMLEAAERLLAGDGVTFLQVKTLSPRSDDPNYAKTREFYLAYGFRVLEEFPELWDPANPALQMIKVIEREI